MGEEMIHGPHGEEIHESHLTDAEKAEVLERQQKENFDLSKVLNTSVDRKPKPLKKPAEVLQMPKPKSGQQVEPEKPLAA